MALGQGVRLVIIEIILPSSFPSYVYGFCADWRFPFLTSHHPFILTSRHSGYSAGLLNVCSDIFKGAKIV